MRPPTIDLSQPEAVQAGRLAKDFPALARWKARIADIVSPAPELVPENLVFSPELQKIIGKDGLRVILEAYDVYQQAYGVLPSVSFDVASVYEPDFEESSPGSICYQPGFLKRNRDMKDFSLLRTVTLHALTHASAPEKVRQLTVPLIRPNQCLVSAIRGFILYLDLRYGRKQFNHRIEEGVAEALASEIDPDHMTKACREYQRVGMLSKLVISEFFSPERMSAFVRNNGILEFARELTGPTCERPLYQLAAWYDAAYEGASPDKIMQSILNCRRQFA
ncbi:MAG: hypothetical protein PHU23_16075 [Dehalococcoidales bacterium]|nr:hypothetical protein [Dehalococcoidales bacterium]